MGKDFCALFDDVIPIYGSVGERGGFIIDALIFWLLIASKDEVSDINCCRSYCAVTPGGRIPALANSIICFYF